MDAIFGGLRDALRKVWAFLTQHKKAILFSILGIVLIFFVWLNLFFSLGDDLIMQFDANQTSFRITNAATAPVTVTLSTQNQVFCTAQCSFMLSDVSTAETLAAENFTHKRGETLTREFSLTPRERGTGQVIYSLTASCHNVQSFFCPTTSPERRKAILLTLNYELTGEESALKPILRENLTKKLLLLRETDIAIQDARALGATPRLHAQAVLAQTIALEQSLGASKVFLEGARKLWQEEDYDALANYLNTPDTLEVTLADANSIGAAVKNIATTHNALASRLTAARANLVAVIAGYDVLSADAQSRAAVQSVVSASDTFTGIYTNDTFTSYGSLERGIAQLENQTTVLRAMLDARYAAVTALGVQSLVVENNASCSRNETCLNISGVQGIAGACTALAQLNASRFGPLGISFLPYCAGGALPRPLLVPLAPVVLAVPNSTSAVDVNLVEHAPTCCVFGACGPCCNTDACKDDPHSYPVLFVHGHAFNSGTTPEYSLGGYFSKIQRKLQDDGYLDAGIITPSSTFSDVAPGEWGLSGKPVTARVTYYYNFYKSGTDYVLIAQKSENIETYAIRLKEMIDIMRHHTGKQKVDIVAHSMGGLVVRRYMQLFGDSAVDKVIFIATPNAGISGRTKSLCSVLGASKECDDMNNDSVFMRKLSDPADQPSVPMVTIAGSGCDTSGADGDGVATRASVEAINATHYVVQGTCSDFFGSDLHTDLVDIDKYPQVYAIIKETLTAQK